MELKMMKPSQRLGVTRGGISIVQPWSLDPTTVSVAAKNYSSSDHFDAHALFEFLISRELFRNGKSSNVITVYQQLSRYHDRQLSPLFRKSEMNSLGLITILDVVQYGKGLADSIFQD